MPSLQAFGGRIAPAILMSLIVAADRVSKVFIQRSMNSIDSIPVVPSWLRIIHTENAGAAFGMLADGSALLRSALLIGVSLGVVVFVAWGLWNREGSFSSPVTRLGLALILGGAIGNLYDRIIYGTVTDFIEVYHRGWSFPAFNVADSAITVGALFLLIDLLRTRRRSIEPRADFAHK